MIPRIAIPTFELEVPSTKEKIKFRPFLSKEEKVLLMAAEAKDDNSIYEAMKQIVSVCILMPKDTVYDVSKLTMYDLEYIFLQIRAKSINNIIEQKYKDNEDNKIYKFDVDLDKVKVINLENIKDNKIKLSDEIGVIMKQLTLKDLDFLKDRLKGLEYDEDMITEYIKACIDQVYDKENVYIFSQEPEEEKDAWVDTLTHNAMELFREYFDKRPRLHYVISYENAKGNKRHIVLSKLSDFFTWR